MKQCLKVLLGAIMTVLPMSTSQAGQEVDPYLWLEEVRGEKPLEWAKAHSEATLSALKAQPGFEETYAKTLEVLDSDVRIPYPQFEGKYLYNFWKDKNNERGLWRRTTLDEYRKPVPKWEVLLDIGVSDHFVDATVQAILKGGRTGTVGDGKVFVIPVEKVYRIRTGEEDRAAVTPVTVGG